VSAWYDVDRGRHNRRWLVLLMLGVGALIALVVVADKDGAAQVAPTSTTPPTTFPPTAEMRCHRELYLLFEEMQDNYARKWDLPVQRYGSGRLSDAIARAFDGTEAVYKAEGEVAARRWLDEGIVMICLYSPYREQILAQSDT
jgi:hypothetical protein